MKPTLSVRFSPIVLTTLSLAFIAGCATAPKTLSEKRALISEADATLERMIAKDADLRDFLDQAYGYAVFPNIGKGGVLVGGAYGRGAVFEQGRPIGYAELNQGSIGAQLGGQTFAEIIAFQSDNALARLKAGNFDLGAEATAVILKAGKAAEARFEGGVAVFIEPRGGLMAGLAISGQKLNFESLTDDEMQDIERRDVRPGTDDGDTDPIDDRTP